MKQLIATCSLIFLASFSKASDKIIGCMDKGDSRTSENSCYKLHFKDDGDFVIENILTGKINWRAGVNGKNSYQACFYTDGRLSIVNNVYNSLWESSPYTYNSYGYGQSSGNFAKITDDGQLQIFKNGDSTFFGPRIACSNELIAIKNIEKVTTETYKIKRKIKVDSEIYTKMKEFETSEVSRYQQEYSAQKEKLDEIKKFLDEMNNENEKMNEEIGKLLKEQLNNFNIWELLDDTVNEFAQSVEESFGKEIKFRARKNISSLSDEEHPEENNKIYYKDNSGLWYKRIDYQIDLL